MSNACDNLNSKRAGRRQEVSCVRTFGHKFSEKSKHIKTVLYEQTKMPLWADRKQSLNIDFMNLMYRKATDTRS